jgi:hypothetical protein
LIMLARAIDHVDWGPKVYQLIQLSHLLIILLKQTNKGHYHKHTSIATRTVGWTSSIILLDRGLLDSTDESFRSRSIVAIERGEEAMVAVSRCVGDDGIVNEFSVGWPQRRNLENTIFLINICLVISVFLCLDPKLCMLTLAYYSFINIIHISKYLSCKCQSYKFYLIDLSQLTVPCKL